MLGPEACNFIKKETMTQVFSCAFSEISKNTFLTEHLRRSASIILFILAVLFKFNGTNRNKSNAVLCKRGIALW